jgi:hypothetical protein
MPVIFKRLIEREVDQLFREMEANASHGDRCENPVTGGSFIWGDDPLEPQKEAANAALLAREWFHLNTPVGTPPLPLSGEEIERYRRSGGLRAMVGSFARSLARVDHNIDLHPSFYDFARGLMTMNSGSWGIENNPYLKRRFPPRPLAGMTPCGHWAPPAEFAEIMACYNRSSARAA